MLITSWAYTPELQKKKKKSGVQKTLAKIRYDQISGTRIQVGTVVNSNLDHGIISFSSVHRRHCQVSSGFFPASSINTSGIFFKVTL